ncbi:MAG: RES family NAD+ phosphorylase [Steroidobacteraceae bacterium]|mgnify:FL=1|nr:RES family NAD+ phosphorylase [Steroidobacteraceae bacterium]MBP7014449.1 RES family NAD+ phosphorylase [Steroidobacteraceae bacterium]
MRRGAMPVGASEIDWRAFRIVPSRYPPVGAWERLAPPGDFEALAELAGLTNPRLREELGVLGTVPRERWVSGPGTTSIMAAFTHLNPEGSRFSDGTYGVFYAAREVETAIRETAYHRERFLARTEEPPQRVQMRCYVTSIQRCFDDIRGGYPALHDPNSYAVSQRFARDRRSAKSDGVVYDSVRRSGGQCVAAFWPDCVGACTQRTHYDYLWDGATIAQVIELKAVDF